MNLVQNMLLKALNSDLVNTEFSAAPTVDPTVAHVHLNKCHVRNLAPVSKENTQCTSQHKCITIFELVHTVNCRKSRTLFINYNFSLADGGQNFSKIAIKAQTLWPKFAKIIN